MKDLVKQGYIGNPAQLVTLRRVTISEGRAKGAGVIEVKTAAGLELDILPDTGLDLGMCRFNGVNMSWMCKNGYDSPSIFGSYEEEYMNTFPGGLIYTCGLRNAGPANRDNGEWMPTHGRYHSLAAEQVSARIVDDEIIVSGVIRETRLFGHVLEVERTITIPVFGSSVTVSDKLTNYTPKDEEIIRIYHCNFGYPLLSEKARLILPEGTKTTPRTEFAATGLDRACEFDKPADNEEERVFFQDVPEAWARLENPELDTAMTISWSGDTLPMFSEWRSMGSGDYVLGLEPTNCRIMGRHDERENGTLEVLGAYESIDTFVKIEFSRLQKGNR